MHTSIRKSKDYVYGIWVYKALGILPKGSYTPCLRMTAGPFWQDTLDICRFVRSFNDKQQRNRVRVIIFHLFLQAHGLLWFKRVWRLIALRGVTIPASPDSKVHEANMGPIWGRQDPGGPHVGPMNFAIWVFLVYLYNCKKWRQCAAMWFSKQLRIDHNKRLPQPSC